MHCYNLELDSDSSYWIEGLRVCTLSQLGPRWSMMPLLGCREIFSLCKYSQVQSVMFIIQHSYSDLAYETKFYKLPAYLRLRIASVSRLRVSWNANQYFKSPENGVLVEIPLASGIAPFQDEEFLCRDATSTVPYWYLTSHSPTAVSGAMSIMRS